MSSFTSPQREIELDPAYPEPGETVTATLRDYSSQTFGAGITWVLDGEAIPNATDQRSVEFVAPALGSSQELEVVLTEPSGTQSFVRTMLEPSYLDIIIEPQTRVPNDYEGRALPSLGSMVNATAILTTGQPINPADYVYTWRLNRQTVLEEGPIRGGNQVSFTMPWGDQSILSLEVSDRRGQTIAQRSVVLPSVSPELHFYEQNSLYGRQPRSLGASVTLSGGSLVITGEPYYLDTRVFNQPDILEWSVDGQVVTPAGGNPYQVTIQRVRQFGGAQVELHVRDRQQLLQGDERSLRINY